MHAATALREQSNHCIPLLTHRRGWTAHLRRRSSGARAWLLSAPSSSGRLLWPNRAWKVPSMPVPGPLPVLGLVRCAWLIRARSCRQVTGSWKQEMPAGTGTPSAAMQRPAWATWKPWRALTAVRCKKTCRRTSSWGCAPWLRGGGCWPSTAMLPQVSLRWWAHSGKSCGRRGMVPFKMVCPGHRQT